MEEHGKVEEVGKEQKEGLVTGYSEGRRFVSEDEGEELHWLMGL